MTSSLSARLRRLWLDVHLWIGVGLLIAIVPISASGAILVWKAPLDRMMHADRYAVSGEAALPAGRYVAAAREAFAGRADFTQLRLPEKAGDPVVAVGRLKGEVAPGARPRSLTVWIDPPTARVLAAADTSQSAMQWLHRLHGSLLIPEVGRKVVGWIGWAMFVSCATGLWLWWPRNGALLKALRWRRGPSTLFNLHHTIGFWICLPLAVLSLTGVYISFPQTSRAVFGVQPQSQDRAPAGRPGRAEGKAGGPDKRASGGAPQGRFAPPLATPRLTIDQAVTVAAARADGARVISVSAPTVGREPAWRVQVEQPGQATPATLQVVDGSGEVKPDRGGGGDPVSRWMRNIHDGGDTGLLWQTIIVLGGVAPVILALSGVVMWLRRRSRRLAITRATKEG
ncbi:PepSY-associated TM helix domain-containing protein [Brevundimonas sp.]|uniref:PepSY-associated TM helix domain-containing protein n=1 Tax=Brevundimonas sp. TaxID=1871086 RepID=UPI002D389724|nr:PepSY-associated TM helix domain-containing protein [Brevundimonas sp.]HYC68717.1 PepSY-associated TM helix domain-containing protein [Brevundimonas sp.]